MVRQILSNNNEKCYRNFSPKFFTTKRGQSWLSEMWLSTCWDKTTIPVFGLCFYICRHGKLRAQRHMDVLVQYIAAAVKLPRLHSEYLGLSHLGSRKLAFQWVLWGLHSFSESNIRQPTWRHVVLCCATSITIQLLGENSLILYMEEKKRNYKVCTDRADVHHLIWSDMTPHVVTSDHSREN
jgi:hypothetical protein